VKGRLREDSGVIAVIVAVFSVVMFSLAALVVDLGMARQLKRDAQTAADAAVLAGAGELYSDTGALQVDQAVDAVKNTAAANFGTAAMDWSTCSTSLPTGWSASVGSQTSGTSCIAFYTAPDDADGLPNQLQVVVPTEPAGAFLGGLLGYEGSDIGATAQGSAISSRVPSCTLCVLGPLRTGSSQVGVFGGGSLHAGSEQDLKPGGSIIVTDGGTISFTGRANPPNGPNYSPNPPVTNSGVLVRDHFADRPMPSTAGLPDSGSDSAGCGPGGSPSLAPGRYQDITIKNGTCRLDDGLFVITGRLDFQSALSRIEGDRVTLYFTCGTRQAPGSCGSGSPGGWLDADRKGLSLGAPFFGGFSVLYDRGNTSDLVLELDGASEASSFGGAIYAKLAHVVVERGEVTVNGELIVGSLELKISETDLFVRESAPPTMDGPPEILLTK